MLASQAGNNHQGTSLSVWPILCVSPRTNTWACLSELALTDDLVLAYSACLRHRDSRLFNSSPRGQTV